MSILIRDAGVWKENSPSVRDGGVWKPVDSGYVKDAGVWKEMFSSGSPAIGEPYEGGYYAGLIQVGAVTYALIVAPKTGGQSPTVLQYGNYDSYPFIDPDAYSTNDGWTNTNRLTATEYAAAKFCRDLVLNGYDDWYLPASDELEILYRNFKPTTNNNNTSTGANPSSVPPQANYTTGNPAQTTVNLFKSGQPEAFDANNYWSSTDGGPFFAAFRSFLSGASSGVGYTRASRLYVRAVRRVPLA